MPHPVRQMRLRKQRREQNEENVSTGTRIAPQDSTPAETGQNSTANPEHDAAAAAPTAPGVVRLHKIMADHGLGSRRGLEDAIRDGKITVNGEVAQIGQTVQAGDKVYFEGRPVTLNFSAPTFPRVLMYHKPTGEIVSRDDPEGRLDVFERLPAISHGRWISIGRLDLNTEGLLLFTDSGELAHRLMHPRHDIEREYAVRVYGVLTGEQCRKLLQGVQLEDGPARVVSLKDQGGEGANHWYHIVLKEGRYREVRRLFAALELTVSRLIRVRYACLQMPSTLRRGDLEELNVDAVTRLMRVVGLSASHFTSEALSPDALPAPGGRIRANSNARPRTARPERSHQGGTAALSQPPRSSHRDQREPYEAGTQPNRQGGERFPANRSNANASANPAPRRYPREETSPRRNQPYREGERGGRRFEGRAEEGVPGAPREEGTGDINLKGGGGRHPFKRYSQRRVMSHQREEGQQAAPVAAAEVLPVSAPVRQRAFTQEEEDALLQQRYAEQEKRGELRGLAGQTLGAEGRAGRDSFTGNRKPFGAGGHSSDGYRGGGGGAAGTGYGRSSKPYAKPATKRFGEQSRGPREESNYGNRGQEGTRPGFSGQPSSSYGSRRPALGEANTGNSGARRREGGNSSSIDPAGTSRYPRAEGRSFEGAGGGYNRRPAGQGQSRPNFSQDRRKEGGENSEGGQARRPRFTGKKSDKKDS